MRNLISTSRWVQNDERNQSDLPAHSTRLCNCMSVTPKSRRVLTPRRRGAILCTLFSSICMGVVTRPALAQCEEQQKLTATDEAERRFFGGSVSVSGNTALVGKNSDDCMTGRPNCGAAYVFRFNGTDWVEVQKLTASDASANDYFGHPVAVSGNSAVVGARGDNSAGADSGSAYVFRFNGTYWVEEQKLTASDAAELDGFRSVSVNGDTIVAGARGDDCAAGRDCGATYVFRFNGTDWVEEQKLTASDAAANDHFGGSVSVRGATVVVGAGGDDCMGGSSCGSAYVFRFNGTDWVEEQKLAASDAAASDVFGFSVSVSGEAIVVGAWQDDCAVGFSCGSAYVFRFNGTNWVQEQKLTASDAAGFDQFGVSVSVSENTVLVGAFKTNGPCPTCDSGSAYLFRFNGTNWVQEQELKASNAAAGDGFGVSVSLSGETAVVGAHLADCTAGINCGAAYVFSCASAPMVANLDIKPGSCPNPVNPKSRGIVPVTLAGSLDFDVATVDPDSLTLARVDGVGGRVSPISDRRGPRIVIEDLVTPFGNELCGCHELGGDGIDDLSLKFSTSATSRAFELNALPRGEAIKLVLRGTLQDGTIFEAVDCIVIPGRRPELRGLRPTGKN